MKVKIKEKCDELEDDIQKFLQQNKPKVTVIFNKKEVSHSITVIPVGKIRKLSIYSNMSSLTKILANDQSSI